MKEELWNGGGKFGVGERGGTFGVGEKGGFFHGDRVCSFGIQIMMWKVSSYDEIFFSKISFFDYKVLLEIYKVFNIFSKVLKDVW